MGELATQAVWTSQMPQTESEKLPLNTPISQTGNRKSLVSATWLREPAWVATSAQCPTGESWQVELETDLAAFLYEMYISMCVFLLGLHINVPQNSFHVYILSLTSFNL